MGSPNEDCNMEHLTEGDQASSGQSPRDPQGFEHRTEKKNRNGNLPMNGATNGEEMEPSKKKKMILDSSVDPQQVAPHHRRPDHPGKSYRVPDSAVSASFQKQMSLNVPSEMKQGDQASSGQSPTDPQGDDHNTEKESSNGNLPVNGAPESEKKGPSKEDKITLVSSVDPQQVATHSGRPDHRGESSRVPDSPVPASFQELMSLDVPSEMKQAAETLGKYYLDNDPNIKKFFKILVKACKESDSGSSKTWSSHAGTVKVHKIVTGKTFGADEALLKQLNCKELQVEMMDRQGCDIIILFCPINSRVGSDVEVAMRQVSGEERVILILMHHTRDVDYSTAAKRWSETLGNVVFDINVLYHETVPGLLKSLKNTEAISDIRKELMQYSSSTNESFISRHWPSVLKWNKK